MERTEIQKLVEDYYDGPVGLLGWKEIATDTGFALVAIDYGTYEVCALIEHGIIVEDDADPTLFFESGGKKFDGEERGTEMVGIKFRRGMKVTLPFVAKSLVTNDEVTTWIEGEIISIVPIKYGELLIAYDIGVQIQDAGILSFHIPVGQHA